MHDRELYRHLLGLTDPWTVTEVKLDVSEQRVDVWVDHPRGLKWKCPECGEGFSLHDHGEERVWRHLDSCQFKTYLHASPPRVKCPRHGVSRVRLPWAEPNSRFTALFERLAIEVLRETGIQGASRILRMSWDEAWGIMSRAVARGKSRQEQTVTPRIGVDEKSFKKRHRYVTIVSDLDKGVVVHVGEHRRKSTLDAYFQGLTNQQKEGIQAVAMDMWDPYVQSVEENLPNGEEKIVFDRYHIMKHMNDAVDKVRKKEHRALMKEGIDILKRSKYLWLYAKENLPPTYKDQFKAVQEANLKTGRAWAIKESLRRLWSYRRKGWLIRFWKQWYFWATHSKLGPVIQCARTLRRRLDNIFTYVSHPITNATSEGLNSKIQTIKKTANGFRNFQNFITAIYFHCGGLDLFPQTH